MCRAGDGRIWFSTTRGLIVIDPKNLVRDLPPTSVIVEDVVVNGRGRDISEIGQLPPGSSNVSFSYTGLSLITPMRTTFRYKLEGFNRDWVNAGSRREAFYTNLSPGRYRFRVEARIADNSNWEASQPLDFSITPRFYQTAWFLPLWLRWPWGWLVWAPIDCASAESRIKCAPWWANAAALPANCTTR